MGAGQRCCSHRVTVSQPAVLQAAFVVELEAQVVLLALGSGLAGAAVVNQPPEDYGKALSPAPGDFRAAASAAGGRHPEPFLNGCPVLSSLSFHEPRNAKPSKVCLV